MSAERFSPAIAPYLYEVLWELALYGPLTAAEVAEDHNRPRSVPEWMHWTPQGAASRLRTLANLGLVERNEERFWSLTKRGRKWLQVKP